MWDVLKLNSSQKSNIKIRSFISIGNPTTGERSAINELPVNCDLFASSPQGGHSENVVVSFGLYELLERTQLTKFRSLSSFADFVQF